MKSLIIVSAALALCIGMPATAQENASGAAPAASAAASQALAQCLVLKSTGADRLAVARWLLSSIASAPKAADVVTLRPGQRDAADKGMADVFTHLLTVDCAVESKVLFKDRSKEGFRVAGEALGRVAMEELFNDPKAQEALASYTRYLNESAFAAVLSPPKR